MAGVYGVSPAAFADGMFGGHASYPGFLGIVNVRDFPQSLPYGGRALENLSNLSPDARLQPTVRLLLYR